MRGFFLLFHFNIHHQHIFHLPSISPKKNLAAYKYFTLQRPRWAIRRILPPGLYVGTRLSAQWGIWKCSKSGIKVLGAIWDWNGAQGAFQGAVKVAGARGALTRWSFLGFYGAIEGAKGAKGETREQREPFLELLLSRRSYLEGARR